MKDGTVKERCCSGLKLVLPWLSCKFGSRVYWLLNLNINSMMSRFLDLIADHYAIKFSLCLGSNIRLSRVHILGYAYTHEELEDPVVWDSERFAAHIGLLGWQVCSYGKPYLVGFRCDSLRLISSFWLLRLALPSFPSRCRLSDFVIAALGRLLLH